MYQFNKYSWFLVTLYMLVAFTMEYHSPALSWEGLYLSCPIILSIIFWSEGITPLFNKEGTPLTKSEGFNRDLFLISFSFISGELLLLLFEDKNSDVLGWWPVIIDFITIYGFICALIFSLSALALDNHKKYTCAFASLFIVLIPLLIFLPRYVSFFFWGEIEFFYVVSGLLISVHLLLCFGYWSMSLLQKRV
ncbi:TPA: hypothetical protein ACNBB8_003162 [Legionella pneumophila]